MFFFSAGIGTGVVIATADRTVMGRIANLASSTGTSSTTMSREMNYFVNIIIVASVVMGVVFLIALLALGYNWMLAIVFLIGIIMGNVPEGLLTTVTVSSLVEPPFSCYSNWHNSKLTSKDVHVAELNGLTCSSLCKFYGITQILLLLFEFIFLVGCQTQK